MRKRAYSAEMCAGVERFGSAGIEKLRFKDLESIVAELANFHFAVAS